MDSACHGDGRIAVPADLDRLADETDLDEPPEALLERWLARDHRVAPGDRPPTVEDFAVASPTRHEVHVDGRVRYTESVLDALAAATVADDRASVRSVDPVSDVPVLVEFGERYTDVLPEEAVIAVAPDAVREATVEEWIARIDGRGDCVDGEDCRPTGVFESEAACAQWADARDERILAVSLSDVVGLFERLDWSNVSGER